MYRLLFFLATVVIPVIFGWWLFLPMALLFVYLAKLPFEIILASLMLDMVYYFGDSFFYEHLLVLFSLFLIITAFFLNKMVRWPKRI